MGTLSPEPIGLAESITMGTESVSIELEIYGLYSYEPTGTEPTGFDFGRM
jgi:hypothetical protein